MFETHLMVLVISYHHSLWLRQIDQDYQAEINEPKNRKKHFFSSSIELHFLLVVARVSTVDQTYPLIYRKKKSHTMQFYSTDIYLFAVSVISDLNGSLHSSKSSGNFLDDTNFTYSVSTCQINEELLKSFVIKTDLCSFSSHFLHAW